MLVFMAWLVRAFAISTARRPESLMILIPPTLEEPCAPAVSGYNHEDRKHQKERGYYERRDRQPYQARHCHTG